MRRSSATTPRGRRLVAAVGAALAVTIVACDAATDADEGTRAESRALAERGRELLRRRSCGSCHEIPGVRPARGVYGPTLAAFGERSYIAGELPNTPELLQRFIEDPPALVPGTRMPRVGVSADEARAMAAYLLTLR